MLYHHIQKKIKKYKFSRQASQNNDLVRKSFSGKRDAAHYRELAKGKLIPIILSIVCVNILVFAIWEIGNSKAHRENTLVKFIKKEPVIPGRNSQPSHETDIPKKGKPLPEAKKNYQKNPVAVSKKQEGEWDRITKWETFRERPVKNTILVDKANRKLYVAQRQNGYYKIIKEFEVSIGQFSGNKIEQGDLRTPEGIYRVIDVMFDDELAPKYGPMAFVLSYPNDRDRLLGKTGSGIWLHGTGQGGLTPDTKGCVELTDEGILDLSRLLAYNTPIFIFPERRPLNKKGSRIPISTVNGLEMEYTRELPLLQARLKQKGGG